MCIDLFLRGSPVLDSRGFPGLSPHWLLPHYTAGCEDCFISL